MNRYYVYALSDANGKVFYIGKGRGERYLASKRKRRATCVEKIGADLTEAVSFELERFLIQEIGRAPLGPLLNRCSGGQGASGHSPSPETRKKMSESQIGKKRQPLSPEHRAKIGAAGKGRTQSEKAREKLREINTGKKLSPETRQKLSKAKTGHVVSPETKVKISAYQKIRPRKPHSEETKLKISAKKKGRPLTPEHIANMARGHVGIKLPPRSPETCAKISAANKGWQPSDETRARMILGQRARRERERLARESGAGPCQPALL